MKVSLIWAMDKQRLIGAGNALPWRLPADMKWFRRHTLGKPIIMGQRTFESLGSQPLPDRINIVMTHAHPFQNSEVIVVHSIKEALAAAGDAEEVMVIGGASCYTQMLPRADRLYVTLVQGQFEGDAWFPDFSWDGWRETVQEESHIDGCNAHPCRFLILERRCADRTG